MIDQARAHLVRVGGLSIQISMHGRDDCDYMCMCRLIDPTRDVHSRVKPTSGTICRPRTLGRVVGKASELLRAKVAVLVHVLQQAVSGDKWADSKQWLDGHPIVCHSFVDGSEADGSLRDYIF